MANAGALAQGLQGYNFALTPDANVKMRQMAQEQALADALREQGNTPLDTSHRQIGGVGYAISPMESAAKIAQQLVGAYGTYDANSKFNDMMNPQPTAAPPATAPAPDADAQPAPGGGVAPGLQGAYPGDAPPMVGAPGFAQIPDAPAQQPAQGMGPFNPQYIAGVQHLMQMTGMSMQEAMANMGDPNANARVYAAYGPTGEMKNAQAAYGPEGAQAAIRNIMDLQQYPGQTEYQKGLGTNAAGQAPAGTMPAGPGAPMPPRAPQAGAVPAAALQTAARAVQPPPGAPHFAADGSIALNAPPPGGTGPIEGLEGAPQAAPAGAGRTAALPPLDPTGMTNDQYKAAVEAQRAEAAAHGTETGKNLGEAEKGAASIDSRMGVAKQTLQHILDLAPKVSSGMAIGTKEDFANQFNGRVAADNKDFTISSSRLFLQELPAVMASLSNRGNQFMEKKIQEAGSIDIADHPQAKIRAAKILMDALDQAKQMSDTNVVLQGGKAPGSVHWVVGPNGSLVRQ